MRIDSYAFALEDVFSLYLCNFKPGFFVDIGCGHPEIGSNSKLLEQLGWRGICVDVWKDPDWDTDRTTNCLVADAMHVPYSRIFQMERAPAVIDVLFIDVDDCCYEALKAIPFNYEYRCIIIEHDFYRSDELRDPERRHLAKRGYELACADVFHEPDKPFEDWWLNPSVVNHGLINTLGCSHERDIDIVRRFGHSNTIVRRYGFNGVYPKIEIA